MTPIDLKLMDLRDEAREIAVVAERFLERKPLTKLAASDLHAAATRIESLTLGLEFDLLKQEFPALFRGQEPT